MFAFLWSCIVIFFKGLLGMWIFIISLTLLTLAVGFTYQAFGGNLEDKKEKLNKYTGKSVRKDDTTED